MYMGEINHVLVGYRFLVARNKTPIVERHLTKINGKKIKASSYLLGLFCFVKNICYNISVYEKDDC